MTRTLVDGHRIRPVLARLAAVAVTFGAVRESAAADHPHDDSVNMFGAVYYDPNAAGANAKWTAKFNLTLLFPK